jgi:DNA-binding NarL/FixJ family response regulator
MSTIHLALFSGSVGFSRHVSAALLGCDVSIHAVHASVLRLPSAVCTCDLALIHCDSQREYLQRSIALLRDAGVAVAIAADVPDLQEMLELSTYGTRAYFNSYMADVHYQQMVTMVTAGQTWISPPLMAGALDLARSAARDGDGADALDSVLQGLTNREREIACDVASGKTNQEIASVRHIAERTVKSHLTHIFKKLGTRNRQALTLRIRDADQPRTTVSGAGPRHNQ